MDSSSAWAVNRTVNHSTRCWKRELANSDQTQSDLTKTVIFSHNSPDCGGVRFFFLIQRLCLKKKERCTWHLLCGVYVQNVEVKGQTSVGVWRFVKMKRPTWRWESSGVKLKHTVLFFHQFGINKELSRLVSSMLANMDIHWNNLRPDRPVKIFKWTQVQLHC